MALGTNRSPAADALAPYRGRRDFRRTPEPSGGSAAASTGVGLPRFVVQRHPARRLHYDFRPEGAGGVVSWAGEEPFKHVAGLITATGEGVVVGQPEGAGQKGALAGGQSVEGGAGGLGGGGTPP